MQDSEYMHFQRNSMLKFRMNIIKMYLQSSIKIKNYLLMFYMVYLLEFGLSPGLSFMGKVI